VICNGRRIAFPPYDTLSFAPIDAAEPPAVAFRLGVETIELAQHTGRPLPRHARSNDRSFQQLAIVVSDIDRA